MFGVCDVAETVATRKDRCLKRYVLSSSIQSARYVLFVVKFFFFLVYMYVLCATVFSVNKDVCKM